MNLDTGRIYAIAIEVRADGEYVRLIRDTDYVVKVAPLEYLSNGKIEISNNSSILGLNRIYVGSNREKAEIRNRKVGTILYSENYFYTLLKIKGDLYDICDIEGNVEQDIPFIIAKSLKYTNAYVKVLITSQDFILFNCYNRQQISETIRVNKNNKGEYKGISEDISKNIRNEVHKLNLAGEKLEIKITHGKLFASGKVSRFRIPEGINSVYSIPDTRHLVGCESLEEAHLCSLDRELDLMVEENNIDEKGDATVNWDATYILYLEKADFSMCDKLKKSALLSIISHTKYIKTLRLPNTYTDTVIACSEDLDKLSGKIGNIESVECGQYINKVSKGQLAKLSGKVTFKGFEWISKIESSAFRKGSSNPIDFSKCKSLTVICSKAFEGIQFKDGLLDLSECKNLRKIGIDAFLKTGIRQVILPDTVISISSIYVFGDEVEEINIPLLVKDSFIKSIVDILNRKENGWGVSLKTVTIRKEMLEIDNDYIEELVTKYSKNLQIV